MVRRRLSVRIRPKALNPMTGVLVREHDPAVRGLGRNLWEQPTYGCESLTPEPPTLVAVAQQVRASPCQGEGRRFDPGQPLTGGSQRGIATHRSHTAPKNLGRADDLPDNP